MAYVGLTVLGEANMTALSHCTLALIPLWHIWGEHICQEIAIKAQWRLKDLDLLWQKLVRTRMTKWATIHGNFYLNLSVRPTLNGFCRSQWGKKGAGVRLLINLAGPDKFFELNNPAQICQFLPAEATQSTVPPADCSRCMQDACICTLWFTSL